MQERKPINIEWNQEQQLPDLDNNHNETSISDDYFVMKFEYNGYKIDAQISYTIYLDTETVQGGSDEYGNVEEWKETTAEDFELELIAMYYNDGEDFKVPVKEFMNIQNELLTDLKIQY